MSVRITDITVGYGSHAFPCCSHLIVGIFIIGSPDTFINKRRAIRLWDFTIHTCPHCPVGMTITGSHDTFVNLRKKTRIWDIVTEFCGIGICVTKSPNTHTNNR